MHSSNDLNSFEKFLKLLCIGIMRISGNYLEHFTQCLTYNVFSNHCLCYLIINIIMPTQRPVRQNTQAAFREYLAGERNKNNSWHPLKHHKVARAVQSAWTHLIFSSILFYFQLYTWRISALEWWRILPEVIQVGMAELAFKPKESRIRGRFLNNILYDFLVIRKQLFQ